MVLLRNIDPEGTAIRKSRRLKRRIYRTKVILKDFWDEFGHNLIDVQLLN